MNSILICDTDSEFARRIAGAAVPGGQAKVLYVPSVDDAVAHVRQGNTDVLLIGPTIDKAEALEAAELVLESRAMVSTVIMAAGVDAAYLRSAMRAGVSDVLDADCSAVEIGRSVADAMSRTHRQAEGSESPAETVGGGDIITVFSTKGGVGKSVVSTNLAVALATLGKQVAIMDLDLQFGDVGIMLGLEPTRTIIGAVRSGERLDADMLSGFMLDHPSGLKALLAPTQPEDAELVTASRIDRILGLLSSQYEYVVIDTPPSLDEAVLTALERSTQVIAITMMDVASIKNSRISLQKLRQLGYNGSLVEVLLNRADSKVYLTPEGVEEAIGAPIKYRLPSDQVVPRAVNKGIPVVTEAPRSQPAKVLMATAKAIVAAREGKASDVS